MYVAVKGGERAIENAHRLLAHERRGDPAVPDLSLSQISEQLALAVVLDLFADDLQGDFKRSDTAGVGNLGHKLDSAPEVFACVCCVHDEEIGSH